MDYTFYLSDDCIAVLLDEEAEYDEKQKALANSLNEIISENRCEFRNMFFDYKDCELGEIQEDTFEVGEWCDITLNEDNSGSVYIKFEEYQHSGCRDQCHYYDHAEELDFTVNMKNESITLKTFEKQHRNTVEEF